MYEKDPISDKYKAARQGRGLQRESQPERRLETLPIAMELHNSVAGTEVAGLTIPMLQVITVPDVGPVPVVAGEVLIPTADNARLGEARVALNEFGFAETTQQPRGFLRFIGAAGDLQDALASLARAKLTAAPNHFMALSGWQAKNGSTPELPEDLGGPPQPKAMEGGPGVPVAVVDTGLPKDIHTAAGAWLGGVARGTGDPIDDITMDDLHVLCPKYIDPAAGHGTFVLGMVLQAYANARLASFRALTGVGGGSETDVADAIDRAADWFRDVADADAGPRGVLNLSLGTVMVNGLPPLAVKRAIDDLPDGVIVVAAAGNVPTSEPTFPAAFKNVLGVAALDYDGSSPASWSTFGHWVDFSTNGEGLVSTHVPGRENPVIDPVPEDFIGDSPFALWTGSSFATPLIAGWLAAWMAENPTLPVQGAVAWLRGKGQHLPDYGFAVPRSSM